MPKRSIYLPDELDLQLQRMQQSSQPLSSVIQTALQQYLLREQSVSAPTSEQAAQLEEVSERYAAQARVDYERGYDAGLSRLIQLDWATLDDLAEHEFDVKRWLKPWVDMLHEQAMDEHPEILHNPDPGDEQRVIKRMIEEDTAVHPRRWQLVSDLGRSVHPFARSIYVEPTTSTFRRGYERALADAYRSAQQQLNAQGLN